MKSTAIGSIDYVIAITCHDAGSSELISRYFSDSEYAFLTNLNGPAKEIFQRNGFRSEMSYEGLNGEIDLLVTGISWVDKTYVNQIYEAKLLGITVITFLDHWAFDRDDFSLDEFQCLPDAFVVFDEFAYKRADMLFPEVALLLLPNHYIESMRRNFMQITSSDPGSRRRLLYVSEPISDLEVILDSAGNPIHGERYFSDLDAFRFLMSNIDSIDTDIDHVVIRPHPSEGVEKFELSSFKSDIRVTISTNADLIKDLSEVKFVAGSHTMALAVAAKLGIRSISIIPEGFGDCIIPFHEIEMLRDLVSTSI
jgi:hypothetical protein